MEEVIRSVQLFLVICGGVITIGGAYKVFQDWQKPNKDLKAMVLRHDSHSLVKHPQSKKYGS